jgi:rhamnosyltransferase
VPSIESVKAIIYDVKTLKMCEEYIRRNKIKNAIIYILACRIGPFLAFYKKKFAKQGIKIIVNPDGHEWKRSKWNRMIKAYWKYSDFIAYGADIGASTLTDDDEKYLHWLEKYHIKPNNYYLVVGRFVPENNVYTKFSVGEK